MPCLCGGPSLFLRTFFPPWLHREASFADSHVSEQVSENARLAQR